MFSFITDTIESAINVTVDTTDWMLGGDAPDTRDVAQVVSAGLVAGLSYVAIAEILDCSVEEVLEHV